MRNIRIIKSCVHKLSKCLSLICIGAMPLCVMGKGFTVTQQNLTLETFSLSEAISASKNPSLCSGSPVTKTYQKIAFENNPETGEYSPNFNGVSFPGNVGGKHEWFVVEVTGKIHIPSAGNWTFACGSDDGFRCTISGNGFSDSFTYEAPRSYGTDVKCMNIPHEGIYNVQILYYERGGNAVLDFSVAKGNYSSFSSAFKLVGTSASGVLLADDYIINLNASSDLVDKVKLSWNTSFDVLGERYSVYRSKSKNGPYQLIAARLTSKVFYDTSCLAGVNYYYYVDSNQDIRSDVVIGKRVVKIEEPKFQLTLTGTVQPATKGLNQEDDVLVAGHVLKCRISALNPTQTVTIKKVELIGRNIGGAASRKDHKIVWSSEGETSSFWSYAAGWVTGRTWTGGDHGRNAVDIMAVLKSGPGYHGIYLWNIGECEYEMAGKVYKAKPYGAVTKNVYFDKDGIDNGVSADSFWEKQADGSSRKVRYCKTVPNWFTYWKEDGACPGLRNDNVIYRGRFAPNGKGKYGGAANSSEKNETLRRVWLDRDVADMWNPITVNNPYFSSAEKVFLTWNGVRRVYGIYKVEDTVAHEWQHHDTARRYNAQISAGKVDSDKQSKYCAVKVGYRNGMYAICEAYSDVDRREICDGIVDEDEERNYFIKGLDPNNPDTYGLGVDKAWEYGGYGDNELVSMVAGRNGMHNANPHKDWSYPGELAGGIPVEATSSYKGTRGLSTASLKGLSIKGSSLDELSETNLIVTINSVEATINRYQNSITGIVYTIGVSIQGDELVDFNGYLFDAQSNIVATAISSANASSDSVELFFDSKHIFDNSPNGGAYTLGRVNLTVDDNYSTNNIIGVLYDFSVAPVEIEQGELGCNEAYILPVASCDVSEGGVDVSIPILVNVTNSYSLTAELITTNGDLVATATASNTCAVGTNTFALVFSNDSIFQSGVDGFNAVKNLKLWFGDELIDADAGPFELPTTYSHADFLPTNSYVTIDLTSEGFLDPDIAADGKLSSLKFYFDVTNGTNNTISYDVSAVLFGTNSEMVASISSKINVTNGVNHVEIIIPASSISTSNVDGPYWFRSVELQPQDEMACGATLWPKSQSGVYKASDFGNATFEIGGAPEISSLVDYDQLTLEYSYDATRTGEIVVEAVLVDKNGDFAAKVISTNNVTEIGTKTNTITITCRDITGEDAGAPYAVANISLQAGVDGEMPIYANTDGLTNIYWKTARCFVDANAGSDSNDGRSWDQAYKTISYAIPFANSNNTIAVKLGVYSGFTTGNRAITITAVDGANNTIIDGGGTNRCAYLGSGSSQTNTVLEGFTLRNGMFSIGAGAYGGTLKNCVIENNKATSRGGGVCYSVLEDCILRDNTAAQYGGGAFMSTLRRCFVNANRTTGSYGGGIMDSTAYDCIIQGNEAATYGGGAGYSRLHNCTVIGNSATRYGGGIYDGTAVNSIIWGNTAAISNNHYRAQGVHNCTIPLMSGDGNIDADPLMRGAGFGGFMLSSASPCLNAGLNNGETAFVVSASGVTNATKAIVLDQDFFGNVRTQDGRVDMGAVEGVTNACLVMTKAVGHGSLDVSFELLTPHSSLTVTADESVRPIDRIEISNGRIVRDSKVTLEDITTDVFITAYFKYYDFYVDAENGDDANDGFSAATAKRTIQAAVDCAMDGEKIFVSKGRYAPISTNDKKIEVVATDGVSLTFIDGGKTNRCATLANESSSVSTQTNTVLVGFTLTNGRATSGGGSYGGTLNGCVFVDNTAAGADYCYGGGSYYGVQYDCQYRNNATEGNLYGRGGAAYYGTSYNCSYVNNSASGGTEGNGGAVYYGTHYDCALTNNTASTYGGGGYGGAWYRVTVHKNKAATGGGLYEGSVYVGSVTGNKAINGEGGGTYKTYLNDCYIANNQASGNGGGALLTDDYAYRCAFVNNRSLASGGGVYGGICYDCGITNNVAVSNGGGAYNVTATRTSIVGNSAVSGGGVYNGTYNFCTVSGNTASSDGGGAYNGTFNDSEISGNTASGVGGGSYYATVHRTKILFNTAISDGGGMYRGSGYNSLIAKNKTVALGGGTYNATLYNCTVTENWSGNTGGGTYNGSLYNTIIYGNTNPDGANNAVGSSQTSCKTSDPIFVNAKEGDYRLRIGSSCINSGNASYVNGSTDLALANRVQDGRVDIGAYEGGVEGRVVSVESLGVGKLEYGAYIVTNGGSFVISAQDTGRRFLHFKTNGVIATISPMLILDGISDDVTLTAEFVHELFVDGVSGSDENDGLAWETAKKTIQAAIDASADGDTIWVADGVYEPIDTADKRIDIVSVNGAEAAIIDGGGIARCVRLGDDYRFSNNSRLSGFTLRNGYATYGGGVQYGRADNCIIERCQTTNNGGGVDYTNISNCVIRSCSSQSSGGGMTGGTWRRAFNCQFIGNTARENGGGITGSVLCRNCEFDNNIAGGSGGALYNGIVYDSVFSRNRAASGGATYNGTFYRCLVENNVSTGDGGGSYYGTFYDSIISNNTASGSGGGSYRGTFHRSHILQNKASSNGGGVYNGTAYNSIIVKNTANGSGGGSYSGYNYNCTIVENYAAASGGGTYSGTQYNSIVWNNNNHYGESNIESASKYNCYTGDPLFVNASEGDYRIRMLSSCINAGNASYVNGSYDVAQQARVQDGTVDIGAHEGGIDGFVVKLDFKGGATAEHSSVVVSSNGTFTVYSVAGDRPFTGFFTNGVFVSSSLPFTLSGIGSDIDLSIECVHELYVDADNGDDVKTGFDWADAKQSIQAAIDVSLSGDVIHVADGWYEPFASDNRKIRIISENGPENCIVDGAFESRCATLGSSASEVQTVIEGLTLCNGHSASGGGCAYGTAVNCIIEDCYSTGNGGGAYQTILKDCDLIGNIARSDGGGAYGDRVVASGCLFMDNTSFSYGGGAYSGAYYDSVFDGNSASSRGGAAYGAILQRCILKGNDAPYGGGTYNGTMYSCLYYDNYASSSAGGAYYGTLYNCTLTRNKSASAPAGSYYPTAYNTIIWDNLLNSGSVSDCNGSSYYNCCQTGGSGTGLIAEDPKFFDPANDDFRLSRESPCRDVGNNSNVKESTDILGATRIQDETVDMGCYENAVMVWDISVVVCGDGRVIDYGKSILDKGSLMFEAVEMGFPFLGFYTNGVFATSDKEFTWKNISSDGILEAWFKQDIYVDSAKIDDSGDGLTWETARKDLAAVVAEASNGANIWVKSGTYLPIVTANKKITITAVDGNSTTVIDGGGTNCCVYAYTNNASISVMTNTVVVGFTIRNGYALQGGAAYGGTLCECVIVSNTATRYGGGTYYGVQYGCTYRDNSVDGTSVARGGAAYYGTSYNCIYENNMVNGVSSSDGGAIFGGVRYDCLIKNNVSNTRGGGVAQATCYRCVLTGNSAKTGGGSYSGTLRDCLIAENEAVGNGGGSYGSTLIGCTVVKNIAGDAGGVVAGIARNSIIWENSVTNGVSTNCVSTTLQYSCTDSISGEIGCIIEDPKFVDVENGDYRLLHGSPCIDAGNNSFLAALSTCDIAQKDRVLNRIVDMGCYEGAFSPNAETQSTPKPVPHIWLDSLGILSSFGGDYEAMANAPSPGASGSGKIWPNGSPCYMWQDFVAGTSPTNDAVFTATIRMDGDTPVITWEPDTPELRATRVYRTYGKKTLMDANWTDITDKDMSEYNFFKVTVDLP